MQSRLVITRNELGLESYVMDRGLRFQHDCNGVPHRFRIISLTNRNMRAQAGIVASDRPQV